MAACTCLVTIHGIGFQNSPTKKDGGYQTDGYADPLHQGLAEILGDQLSGDPGRNGANGAVYVQSRSVNAAGQRTAEEGLRRLGEWEGARITVKPDEALRTADQPFAHVALVYSPIEDDVPRPGSLFEGIVRTTLSLPQYATVGGLVHAGIADLGALLRGAVGGAAPPSPSLRARALVSPLPKAAQATAAPVEANAPGALADITTTLNALQDDWAAYISRNDLRERVRGFVREAIQRLVNRDDVAAVVINAHSQGTVVAFDVVGGLAQDDATKIQWFVTSGSPLRKYVDLYTWGPDAGQIGGCTWTNFYDPLDPVADPLRPLSWRLGQDPGQAPASPTLFQCWPDDADTPSDVAVEDEPVDNVSNTTSPGLKAHNYWDNRTEVVPQLAKILTTVAGGVAAPPQAVGARS